MRELADFPATVCRVKTLADGGIRVELDLPETEGDVLSVLHDLRGRYLRVVIYDNDEFLEEMGLTELDDETEKSTEGNPANVDSRRTNLRRSK